MKLASNVLALCSVTALTLISACSAGDGSSQGPAFTSVANDTYTASTAAVSETPAPSTTAAPSLKQRDPQEFLLPNPYVALGSAIDTYGISSPGGDVRCAVQPDRYGKPSAGCDVDFVDPPFVPNNIMPTAWADSVSLDESRGFIPRLKVGGEPMETITLNAGEEVQIGTIKVSAPSQSEFTVQVGEHSFTIKDGKLQSDAYPIQPAADGTAPNGTVCGDGPFTDTEPGQKTIVAVDGTNCNEAMQVVEAFKSGTEPSADAIPVLSQWHCDNTGLPGASGTPIGFSNLVCQKNNWEQGVIMINPDKLTR